MASATQSIKVGTVVIFKGKRATVARTVHKDEGATKKVNQLLATKKYKAPEFSLKARPVRSYILELAAETAKSKRSLAWPQPDQIKPL